MGMDFFSSFFLYVDTNYSSQNDAKVIINYL